MEIVTVAWSTAGALIVDMLHRQTHIPVPHLVALEAIMDSETGVVGGVVNMAAGHQHHTDMDALPDLMWREGC